MSFTLVHIPTGANSTFATDILFSGDFHTRCQEDVGCMREDWRIERICDLCGELSPGGLHRQCVLYEKFMSEAYGNFPESDTQCTP
jgi:hypothetical protein